MDKVGPKKWKQIAFLIGTKTEKQCRDHYSNCLNPRINNSQWSENEEQILLHKYNEFLKIKHIEIMNMGLIGQKLEIFYLAEPH